MGSISGDFCFRTWGPLETKCAGFRLHKVCRLPPAHYRSSRNLVMQRDAATVYFKTNAALWPLNEMVFTVGSELGVEDKVSWVICLEACGKVMEDTLVEVGLTYTYPFSNSRQ